MVQIKNHIILSYETRERRQDSHLRCPLNIMCLKENQENKLHMHISSVFFLIFRYSKTDIGDHESLFLYLLFSVLWENI